MATTTKKQEETPTISCKLIRCDAGGCDDDGGHVFDIPFDDDTVSTAYCRCGMDVMTFTAWLRPF